MKRVYLIFFSLLIAFNVSAKFVNKTEVKSFANSFINLRNIDATISSIDENSNNGTITSYIVNLSPKGFMLIAADDKVEPLLAYSLESNFIPKEHRPDHINWWMNNTHKKIKYKIQDSSTEKNNGWQLESMLKSASATTVAPLIKVKWNQDRKWNQFCPEDEDGPGGFAYVGCVAVSMAQAMSTYGFPTIGKGKASYIDETYGTQTVNFEKENVYQWDSMPAGSANEHNARLLYHCAVTVSMQFGADGSGAYTETAAGALKAYFNYSKTTKAVDRVEDDEEWKNMLIENLENGCPLIYHGDAADGESGHAWNIDGIDASGLFHLNWGWSGSMNGYYNINDLAPGSSDFTQNQGAIFGIKPKQAGPIDLTLDNISVKENRPVGTFVGNVIVDDEYPENPYTYNLKGNPLIFSDGYAEAKFYVENDSLKTLETFDFETRDNHILFIEAVDTLGHSMEKMFEIEIISTVGAPKISEVKGFDIYPNPFNHNITVNATIDSELIFFDGSGRKVYTTLITAGKNIIELSHLKNGFYVSLLRNNEGIFYSKLTKE